MLTLSVFTCAIKEHNIQARCRKSESSWDVSINERTALSSNESETCVTASKIRNEGWKKQLPQITWLKNLVVLIANESLT